MKHDVVVLGAGLAGLAAARDLARGGADVVVLEARHRVGGRVEQAGLGDGRIAQLGGEVVGAFHTAYVGLVEELGLTLVPSFTEVPGEDTWILSDGRFVGDGLPWGTDEDRASYEAVERRFAKLVAEVDPDDPWSHPEAARLDAISVGDWMRDAGATTEAVRARELAMLALASESVERTSLLADLRKEAAAGAEGFYSYELWESMRVEEGSATVALQMADELGERIRFGARVVQVALGGNGGDGQVPGCAVITRTGERFEAEAVICALPVGPLRELAIAGLSPERRASLDRQRNALAAKAVFAYERSFWEEQGQNGAAHFETAVIGGTWHQREGILSALVPPERLAALLATPPSQLEGQLVEEMATAFGPRALEPEAVFLRHWGVDPLTRGYITSWRPGDVTAVGPLHGTHEPPFYVCGSDQWVCGYMEGAVRTGRAAAAAAGG